MAVTHINGYFAAVEEAEANVANAKSELEAAKLALKNKKVEIGYEEPKETKVEAKTETASTSKVEDIKPEDPTPSSVNAQRGSGVRGSL